MGYLSLLTGKVVIVTGASKGIGRQIAFSMAQAGAKVVLVSRNEKKLIAVREEISSRGGTALAVTADVTDEQQVSRMTERTIREFGSINVLVNNAGDSGPTTPIHQLSLDDWHSVVDSSLTGSFLCCKYAVPHMIEGGGGRIINISSSSAKSGLPFRVGYCAAKAGIVGLTRALALELGPHNICVNAIVPGAVTGERLDYVIEQQAKQRGVPEEELRKVLLSGYPLKRVVEPTDIANLALFLAGDSGINITGEDINVTAGGVLG